MIAMYIIIGMSVLAVGAYAWFIHAYQHGYNEQKTPIYSDGSPDYVPAKRVERERDRRNELLQIKALRLSDDWLDPYNMNIFSPLHHADD